MGTFSIPHLYIDPHQTINTHVKWGILPYMVIEAPCEKIMCQVIWHVRKNFVAK